MLKGDLAEVIATAAQGEVDGLDREGRTALFYAAQEGAADIATELIEQGANVNAQDKDLETPLHFAARAHQSEVAELLLKSGARVDSQDVHGNTPLARAVFDSKGRGDMIKVLLAHGADKALKNKYGISPADLAKSIGNYDVSVFLS